MAFMAKISLTLVALGAMFCSTRCCTPSHPAHSVDTAAYIRTSRALMLRINRLIPQPTSVPAVLSTPIQKIVGKPNPASGNGLGPDQEVFNNKLSSVCSQAADQGRRSR